MREPFLSALFAVDSPIFGLCIALGIGLLIGAGRERHKGSGPARGAAGIRTFTVVALLGATGMLLGGGLIMAVAVLSVGVLAGVSYRRSSGDDPGTTTEVALLLTCLLGGLAIESAALAAGLGVTVAALLAAKNRIHFFVREILTERELHDAIIFCAAALIVLPLAPDYFVGPFSALNPRAIARLVVLLMAISGLGHLATRMLGVRFGIPLAGLAAGFISSTATIYAMGERARRFPEQLSAAVAGALLSSVATLVQMAVVVLSIQPALLEVLLKPLCYGGVAACVYCLVFILKDSSAATIAQREDYGRAFHLRAVLGFAAIIGAALLVSAALNAWLGQRGILVAAAVTGLADAHATAASVASLVVSNRLSIDAAQLPILMGLSANAVMKGIVSFRAGGFNYAVRIVPGQILVVGALWLGTWAS